MTMGALFTALAYYYEHRDELTDKEQEFATARRDGEQRTRELLTHVTGRSD